MLISVALQAKADFAKTIEPYELPVHVARALLQLDSPMPMHELALYLGCDRSHVTGLADTLEGRGLLMRIPGSDRRVKLLALTDEGKTLRDQIAVAVTERSTVLRRLSDAERKTLGPLLEKLLVNE
jgi:DNA-binding MarR family transcriptional regulator